MPYKNKLDEKKYRKRWYQKNRQWRNEVNKQWKRDNPRSVKNTSLKINFGITLDQYNLMLLSQKGVCKICKKKEIFISNKSGKVIALAVDHNHNTGKIRGLLCRRCNQILGHIKDSQTWLKTASNYLYGKL